MKEHKDTLSREQRMKIPADCPNCGKTFKNIYSVGSHFGHCSGRTPNYKEYSEEAKEKMNWSKDSMLLPPEEIFVIHRRRKTSYVKRALFFYDIKTHKCESCGLSEWLEQPIMLELDHINGNNLDNRLENLRLLCCNCHAQTPTWRNRKLE